MSFASGLCSYEECMSEEMITTSSFQDKKLEQCIMKKGDNIEESLIVGEEIVVDTNGYLPDKIKKKAGTTTYFEENMETYNKIAAESISGVSVSLVDSFIDDKWACETTSEPWKEIEIEQHESDEETIATFVTAAGTQLALYAVEDSDEIFAVSVYNESGEPPNDFQFLMKADVERLIGEGAVRTVKKPSQMKKRLITNQPSMFYRKENLTEEVSEQANDNIFTRDRGEKSVVQEEDCGIVHSYKNQNYNDSDKIGSMSSNRIHITDEQSDIAYFMMDNNSENIANQSDENGESENELVERSTVQYILLENDHQSDSELTFDDIQTTLRNLKTYRERTSAKDDDRKSGKLQDDLSSSFSRHFPRDSSTNVEPSNEDMDELELYMSPPNNRSSVTEADRQRLIATLSDSPPSATMMASTSQLKVKRSRKQQLISVNRDDGEIIIQPASMLSEEELSEKKRGRRRRRLSSTQMHVAMSSNTKRIKRKKRREVEVIDLDVDEEERQPKRNVVEITLDDSKDKYSSDKENEIIMVRDSDSDNGDDDDEEEEDEDDDDDDDEQSGDDLTKLNGVLRCEHCSRNFRQRRTFDAHLRICQKSPANALRLVERKDKEKSQKIRKQYTCKICQEKFDVVVALARHVRITHSQRKKQRTQEKSWESKDTTSAEEKEEPNDDDTSKSDLDTLTRVKRRRRRKRNSSWEAKKLNCADCGRWFPSSASLNAHSLQHGTKKSEQLRRCHICKKLIKSRMLFLQHLKVHNDTPRTLRRRLRTRPSATPRKRGRPRKF